MGMSWSQYNQQYARETQGAGAGGGAAPSDQPSTSGSPDSGPPSCSHSGCFPGQDLNKIIKPVKHNVSYKVEILKTACL